MSEIKFSELGGKDVLTQDGREIGKVEDLIIQHEAWAIPKLIVKLDRDLLETFHMKKPMFGTQTFHVPTSFVSGIGDKVILHKKLEELTAMAQAEQPAAEADESPSDS